MHGDASTEHAAILRFPQRLGSPQRSYRLPRVHLERGGRSYFFTKARTSAGGKNLSGGKATFHSTDVKVCTIT